ncbi:hypothetical protein N5079_33580 [Planotetraspora sp. A-T 1434]|uniref:hypothetical protein n=1 Tax=Planotetraspora sp. A-T 1434 TaxID=2979219 RepID=UPI0021BF81F4|nr:hypothetical protein [Planotetraspora sp. A-T 1434]MCT9935145.1 hypothetical protein [Planotetraspora sp. A-T 1434]
MILDPVGGEQVNELMDLLADGGTLLFYGGLAGKPMSLPSIGLAHRALTFRGVSAGRWVRTSSRERRRAGYAEALAVARSVPEQFNVTAEYDLARFAEAIEAAEKPGRTGAILLNSDL